MPTRTGPCPGWPVIDMRPPMPWAIWSTPAPARIRAVLAKAGNAAVDDARVDLAHRFVIDAEPVLHVGFVVLDDDIGALGELHKDRAALIAFEVQGHCPLVAVQVLEIGTVAAAAGRVDQLAGGLDLDHLR